MKIVSLSTVLAVICVFGDFSHLKGGDYPNYESGAIYCKGMMRDYEAPIKPNEVKEISRIVETLGNASLVSLAKSQSALERSGKQVDHVHPLQFLMCIFTDEKLKASMHNIRNRSWVWGKFFKGLRSGLEEETNRGNLLPHIADFSRRVGIDPKIIYPLAEGRHWKEFIDALVAGIPRSGNSSRYDM